MPTRVYSCDAKDAQELKKLLEYDPYLDKSLNEQQLAELKNDPQANIIFARQDYQLKDGVSLGLDRERYYLCITAVDDLIEKDEAKLKAKVQSIKRVEPDLEVKIVSTLEEERKESEQGLGMIFG